MTFRRIATTGDRITIETTTGDPIRLSPNALALLSTDAQIKSAIDAAAGNTVPVFVHRNRDGSIAIATGLQPDPWPEDRKPPPQDLQAP